MEITQKLKKYIDLLVERKLNERGILTEAFKSPILSKLYKIAKSSDQQLNRSDKQMFNAFENVFGVRASEIPAEAVTEVRPDKSIVQRTKTENIVAIFVNENEGLIIGGLYKGGWLQLRGFRYNPLSWRASDEDPKSLRNFKNTRKGGHGYGGERRSASADFGRQSGQSGQTGHKSNYAINRDELVERSTTVIIINLDAAGANPGGETLARSRNEKWKDLSKTLIDYKKAFLQRVKDFKAVKRQAGGDLPQDLKEIQKDLDMYSKKILDATNAALSNPGVIDSYDVYSKEYFGGGPNSSSRNNGMLEMYMEIFDAYKRAVEDYNKGEDYKSSYYYRGISRNKRHIENILNKIQSKLAKAGQ